MKINFKVFRILIMFLLLVPFRLPIGVLFIELTSYIANLAGGNINDTILVSNVVVTKIIYDVVLAVISVYNIEMLSIQIKRRRAKESRSSEDNVIYWWTGCVIFLLGCYIIFDGINTYSLYNSLNHL